MMQIGWEADFAAVAKRLSGEAHSSESSLNCFKLLQHQSSNRSVA